MATTLYFRGDSAVGETVIIDSHLGTDSTDLRGNNTGWAPLALATSRGPGVRNIATNTVTGATAGVEVAGPTYWLSPPVSSDVTISGTITANIWAQESSMNANVAINVVIDILRANTTTTRNSNTVVEIVRSTRTTELGFSGANTVQNFTTGMTSGAYTSQTLNRGDRIRIRIFGDDAGTMASGFTFTVGFAGSSASADGDSFVTFTEDFSFESAPAGSQIFLTDTASDVSTASVDREAWTARGSGVVNDVTNTAAGWTAPIQVTDTAGGTVVDWFTKRLQAFTLQGMAVANLRAQESNAAANATLRCQIARVDADGTNATVWADWCMAPSTISNWGELTTSEAAYSVNISGDSLAISDGQRLRIRVYTDDMSLTQMATAQTVTFYYNGTSAASSGDSYVTFPQTLTEFAPAPSLMLPNRNLMIIRR